ncbi:MAG: T9SS type A sorting domain-containing protein [Saprospiraceae bacterium]
MKTTLLSLAITLLSFHFANANFIIANPNNYTTFIAGLVPGDTLFLSAGNYTHQLNLNNKNGTALNPIVIMGDNNNTVLLANACCNTVDFTNCSYLVIKRLKIDGQNINYVDGIKAGGGGNTYAHHIIIEDIIIVNNGGNIEGDNQTVGISTKCAAWNWTIRNCVIIGAGTGIYLGNSDGTSPFVNGLIENNLVVNTRGYNMEIKAQNDGVRDIFPGTAVDNQKTIIRYNVWSKDSGSTPIGQGDGSRPNILMDHLPSTGNGSHDTYEVYGNFFYNNPTEALMQVTGNTTAYDNLFVNKVAPAGYGTIVITNHDGFPPRTMNMFHNTIVSNSADEGIGLFSRDQNYNQYCYANAVFTNGTPITGFKSSFVVDNITDTYANAVNYLNAPLATFPGLDLFPLAGKMTGNFTPNALFTGYTDYDIDFNGNTYDWTYRGAYTGSGINHGWPLQIDLMPTPHGTITAIDEQNGVNDFLGIIYPNPATNRYQLDINIEKTTDVIITLVDLEGRPIINLFQGLLQSGANRISSELPEAASGFYLIQIRMNDQIITRKILIQK